MSETALHLANRIRPAVQAVLLRYGACESVPCDEIVEAVVAHLHSDSPRFTARQRVLAESAGRPICWICELPIPMDAELDSPECFSLDHVVPRADGGALLGYQNLKPAHRLCNALRHIQKPGAKMLRRRDELLAQLRRSLGNEYGSTCAGIAVTGAGPRHGVICDCEVNASRSAARMLGAT